MSLIVFGLKKLINLDQESWIKIPAKLLAAKDQKVVKAIKKAQLRFRKITSKQQFLSLEGSCWQKTSSGSIEIKENLYLEGLIVLPKVQFNGQIVLRKGVKLNQVYIYGVNYLGPGAEITQSSLVAENQSEKNYRFCRYNYLAQKVLIENSFITRSYLGSEAKIKASYLLDTICGPKTKLIHCATANSPNKTKLIKIINPVTLKLETTTLNKMGAVIGSQVQLKNILTMPGTLIGQKSKLVNAQAIIGYLAPETTYQAEGDETPLIITNQNNLRVNQLKDLLSPSLTPFFSQPHSESTPLVKIGLEAKDRLIRKILAKSKVSRLTSHSFDKTENEFWRFNQEPGKRGGGIIILKPFIFEGRWHHPQGGTLEGEIYLDQGVILRNSQIQGQTVLERNVSLRESSIKNSYLEKEVAAWANCEIEDSFLGQQSSHEGNKISASIIGRQVRLGGRANLSSTRSLLVYFDPRTKRIKTFSSKRSLGVIIGPHSICGGGTNIRPGSIIGAKTKITTTKPIFGFIPSETQLIDLKQFRGKSVKTLERCRGSAAINPLLTNTSSQATPARFSYSEYRKILSLALKIFGLDNIGPLKNANGAYLILRHDVDYSPRAALKMAQIEVECGIRATYFFLPPQAAPYQWEKNKPLIHKIRQLGHEIGLHYTADNFDELISQIKTVEAALSIKINSLSMHQPSVKGKIILFPQLRRLGLKNAYDPRYFLPPNLYIADSRRSWRDGHPLDRIPLMRELSLALNRPTQFLTHPVWWSTKSNLTSREVMLHWKIDPQIIAQELKLH